MCPGRVCSSFALFITKVVSSNPANDEVYPMQHYVTQFVSDLRQVDGFLQALCFFIIMNLAAMLLMNYCGKWREIP